MNGPIRFSGSVSFLTLVIWVNTLHAAPSTNVIVEVIDGDTIKIRHKDDGGGKEAIHCLRGAAAPHQVVGRVRPAMQCDDVRAIFFAYRASGDARQAVAAVGCSLAFPHDIIVQPG